MVDKKKRRANKKATAGCSDPTSNSEESVENQNPTDVILVVKGAGNQPPDKHLNLFLSGFWPAITAVDELATISQKIEEREKLYPSPHEKEQHNHITEIKATTKTHGNRTIWVKETYWEPEIIPTKSLQNLLKEWSMTSFALANIFQDVIISRNTEKLKTSRQNKDMKVVRESQDWGVKPGTRWIDFFGNYISYVLLFLNVFFPIVITLIMNLQISLDLITGNALARIILSLPWIIGIAFIWAIAPAIEIFYLQQQRYKNNILGNLPGLPGWMFPAMIFILFVFPAGYFTWLIIMGFVQISFLISRGILYKYRKDNPGRYSVSDLDLEDLYKYTVPSRDPREKDKVEIGRVEGSKWHRFYMSPLLYRNFMFFLLPIGILLFILVSILKYIPGLKTIGQGIESTLQILLVGYLTDVVEYATNPSQAQRVRSVIQNDIAHYSEIAQRIHIIAHSQGTPITYETLYHYLEKDDQEKICTLITIGSVLSYYNQARGLLDPVYQERFPVPIETEKKLEFHSDYTWINFWNSSDPVTEFYGLDEYVQYHLDLENNIEPLQTSPISIKSRTSLSKNHGEYWTNLEQINIPFAKRVLGDLKPKEWQLSPPTRDLSIRGEKKKKDPGEVAKELSDLKTKINLGRTRYQRFRISVNNIPSILKLYRHSLVNKFSRLEKVKINHLLAVLILGTTLTVLTIGTTIFGIQTIKDNFYNPLIKTVTNVQEDYGTIFQSDEDNLNVPLTATTETCKGEPQEESDEVAQANQEKGFFDKILDLNKCDSTKKLYAQIFNFAGVLIAILVVGDWLSQLNRAFDIGQGAKSTATNAPKSTK